MATKLITRAYVCRDDANRYTLEYYLESGRRPGVRIITYRNGEIFDAGSAAFSQDCNFPQKVIHYLAKNFVFPAQLPEVWEDVCGARKATKHGGETDEHKPV
jgi:hypothetical protein